MFTLSMIQILGQENPLNKFTFKNCLFGSTNIVKNNVKENFVYCGYGITFDGAGEQTFNNDFVKNVIIFGVENRSSFHTDNQ